MSRAELRAQCAGLYSLTTIALDFYIYISYFISHHRGFGVGVGDGGIKVNTGSKSQSGALTLNLTNALLLVRDPKLPVELIV